MHHFLGSKCNLWPGMQGTFRERVSNASSRYLYATLSFPANNELGANELLTLTAVALVTPNTSGDRCMAMAELALVAEDNGDATDYTYGEDPNEASTWDAHRIFG